MKFVSTRKTSDAVSFTEAVERGLAPDQGLYVPETWPHLALADIPDHSFTAIAQKVLGAFLHGELPAADLHSLVADAYDFQIPLRYLKDDTAVLELFHGPTAAFKDIAARFLARFMSRKAKEKHTEKRTILVATSGDTGGAVAAAFDRNPNFRVVVLFPDKGVSPLQRQQLTCWSDNVVSLAVRGTFDDCQSLVKKILGSAETQKQFRLESLNFTSANSINIGRLLPQMIYHSAAAIWYQQKTGHAPGLIIPTGNLGDAVAAFWARQIGMPIREIVISTNANQTLANYYKTGKYEPVPSVTTLANAMDVGAPSNFERLNDLFSDLAELKKVSSVFAVSDDEIRKIIKAGRKDWGEIWCPHTATAVAARQSLKTPHWVIVATASPAKFSEIVEPLVEVKPEVPAALAELFQRPSKSVLIDATLEAVANELQKL